MSAREGTRPARGPRAPRDHSPTASSVLTDKGVNKESGEDPGPGRHAALRRGGEGSWRASGTGRATRFRPQAWPGQRSRARPEPRPAPCHLQTPPPPPAETLPAPELSAEPAAPRPAPGTLVRLRCGAPRPGLRLALVREDAGRRRVLGVRSLADKETSFELRHVSFLDSANYSCVYADPAPPFGGSAPSARVELRVEGEWARGPRTRLLWCPGYKLWLPSCPHARPFTGPFTGPWAQRLEALGAPGIQLISLGCERVGGL